MRKIEWADDAVISNYQSMSDREIAAKFGISYTLVFKIRKRLSLERSAEFNSERRRLSGVKGGTTTQMRHDTTGENNATWKGGRSKNKSYYLKRQIEKFPEKHAARRTAIRARLRGKIIQSPCLICGNPKTEAHHYDYSKPLDVIWLCPSHHRAHHNNKLPQSDKEILTNAVLEAGKLLIQ